MGEFRFCLDVLGDAVPAHPFVALSEIFRVQGVGIEIEFADQGADFLDLIEIP